MIVEPERYIEAFRDAGADSLSVHIEAVPEPTSILNRIRELGALLISPKLRHACRDDAAHAKEADILLVMSVPAGFGGQTFRYGPRLSVSARAAARPDALIEIDGGIGADTIGAAAEAGANLSQ